MSGPPSPSQGTMAPFAHPGSTPAVESWPSTTRTPNGHDQKVSLLIDMHNTLAPHSEGKGTDPFPVTPVGWTTPVSPGTFPGQPASAGTPNRCGHNPVPLTYKLNTHHQGVDF